MARHLAVSWEAAGMTKVIKNSLNVAWCCCKWLCGLGAAVGTFLQVFLLLHLAF